MSSEVRVPALPESVADATVLTWHKQPGEAVRKDDNLVDLETDKVVLEVPAPMDGVLAEHKVAGGRCGRGGCDTGPDRPQRRATPRRRPAAATAPHQRRRPALARPREPSRGDQAADPPAGPGGPPAGQGTRLDAGQIPGSGKDGRVHKADVMSWLDRRNMRPRNDRPRGSDNRRGTDWCCPASAARPAAPSSAYP
jgi:2-oxoglutarate dehydrogenase E2 component (dihydrolipoamide succinyltransferase)